MGHGLSDLQEKILVLALFNAGGDVHCTYLPHLYTREVMVNIYTLKADFVADAEWDSGGILRRDLPLRDRRGWLFERERFDDVRGALRNNHLRVLIKAYNGAIAATTRAFARLEKRGLVVRWRRTVQAGAGIVLTPAGYQEALAQLKAFDPDRYQRVTALLESRSNG